MSSRECLLAYELLQEHYGKIAADVASFLLQNGWQPLRYIALKANLKLDQVRKALCLLIQHKLAKFHVRKRKIVEYAINIENVLSILFHPKFIYTVKLLYGDAAELIVEEALQHGIILMSTAIKNVADRLPDENGSGKIEKAFKDLVQTHFLQREPEVEKNEEEEYIVPIFTQNEADLYRLPTLSEESLKRKRSDDGSDEPKAKRLKSEHETPSMPTDVVEDDGVYWSVNISRFQQYFRDQSIVASVTQRFGTPCGEIVRAMLRISEVTTPANAQSTQPISSAEIARSLPQKLPMEHVEQHLKLLSNDEDQIVQLFDDSGSGGLYVVNLKNSALALATATVLSYVQQRYGSKACRIFRLLMLKKHLEQKQVEEFAMIPPKEAKGYLYHMLAENMVIMQEVPRTPDHAPARTFYLYSVNIQRLSRILLVKCYKTCTNLMTRHNHLIKTNKRILDKEERITAIKATLPDADEAQLEEIEEMMTSSERTSLTKHQHCCNKLHTAQNQLLNTIFVLDSYLNALSSA
uniref:DNA-directed RNA polymerase III subunit RPC3 n=1 Tax=Ciona intestinalis TaxID=7719 RepID=UPI000180C6CD|nr:DNA-directed RNA polymerase III subunit RPC3 [Ciona intestinalis]|eukprot:XP_002130318.1 DNA-directed RNA polymerase III subunit RPC3 [Ciona intestinalis]